MHIAFLTPEYPHPELNKSGGLGTSIKNLATRLVEEGVKVTVVVFGQKTDAVFIENSITFHSIRQHKHSMFGFYLYRKFLQKYLNRLILREKIDLVEAPDWTGITAFMRLLVPLVIRFNGSDAYFCKLEDRKQKFKNRLFEHLALKNADGLISVSAFTAEVTREIFNLEKDIAIIPNSIDVSRFKPENEKELPNRILYFGTLIRKKGVLELPEIFNLIHQTTPDTELVFAGKDVPDIFIGKSTKSLIEKQLSDSAKTRVTFLEELPYEAIREEIAKATVVVLPSFAEALPMTWLESMAMEKGLVTSNIGWANEVMEDGLTGYTVSPKDHQAYAKAVLLLLEDQALRRVLGRQAREFVKRNFASNVVIKRNLDFYKNLIED
jgi:L-malate glycosyltransferase